MDGAKIRLSAKEMELVTNADWILTKNDIIEKIKSLFAALQEKMADHLKNISSQLPAEVTKLPPKISKGENYNGLPYLVLDYPRLFDKQTIFAIRTLFWWGNFFSITLHLSGNHKTLFEKGGVSVIEFLKDQDFYICINEDEWQHHFDSSNYAPAKKFSADEWKVFIREKPFIKLAKKYPIHLWDEIINKLLADFKNITGWVILNSPNGEKDL
ncbi:MAG: hypothetical protein JSS70_00990 [Bacteroidetes bacterium]|nr:hypothetical protein [Bacteroidota bacterium]